VDDLIAVADAVLRTTVSPRDWPIPFVDTAQFAEFRAGGLSFISNLYGSEHSFFTDFKSGVSSASPDDTQKGKGILRAIRGELAGGWLRSTKGLIAAELFADFMEMADHLLTEGYKDACAVIIGSTLLLEEHLRRLCVTHAIPVVILKGTDQIAKKADTLNADLAKASVYSMLDQKNVTAWLDLRNKAAHGHYTDYSAEQVRLMHGGVMEFLARVPT
jgi:hypothetical protein